MARVSLELASQRRTQVHELSAAGRSIRQIATALTMSIGSVSHRTLERRVAAAGLARKGRHRMSTRAPYHTRNKPSKYGDMWQMDTKKLRVGSLLVELLVIRDVYTGCTWVVRHNPTQVGMTHMVAMAFSIFGIVPTVFQTDNGTTDFSMPTRSKLRPWHTLAFSRGVEYVQFIPEAEPVRNGS